jgi:hypothetical protein
MIVRIQGEGQYEVADDLLDRANTIDAELEAAVAAGEEGAFRDALERLLALVRESGSRLPTEQLSPSELILPPGDITLDELAQHLPATGPTAA